MNDDVLYSLRQDPPGAFAESLRRRLHAASAPEAHEEPALRGWPIFRIAVGTASAVLVIALFTVPAVRASAESFLALFREVNFVAVPVAPLHPTLDGKQIDLPGLIGENVHVLEDSGPPVAVTSPAAAAASAGFDVRVPRFTPDGVTVTTIKEIGRAS